MGSTPRPQQAGEAARRFRRLAAEHGYLYRRVPRRYGGGEQPPDPIRAQIIAQEFKAARAPTEVMGVGTQMLAPTLLECGEEWQRERFVRKTLEGEYRWCQGFSEPGSGSDLASLRTSARLEGDEWVISGQKVWTSYAKESDYMFALVRTEPDAAKHHGLSYLLLDVKQPGIDIRPLEQFNGGTEFNEAFFDDARTPASWIVGARGTGWKVSRSLLKHERNMIGGLNRSDGCSTRCCAWQPRLSATARRRSPIRGYATAPAHARSAKQSGGRLQMMNKLAQSNFAGLVANTALELLQGEALLGMEAGEKPGNERWMNQYMGSLAAAIAGGTSNIQRNIIAERGLGLPREGKTNDGTTPYGTRPCSWAWAACWSTTRTAAPGWNCSMPP